MPSDDLHAPFREMKEGVLECPRSSVVKLSKMYVSSVFPHLNLERTRWSHSFPQKGVTGMGSTPCGVGTKATLRARAYDFMLFPDTASTRAFRVYAEDTCPRTYAWLRCHGTLGPTETGILRAAETLMSFSRDASKALLALFFF